MIGSPHTKATRNMLTKTEVMSRASLMPFGYTISSVRVRANAMAFFSPSPSPSTPGFAAAWGTAAFEPSRGGSATWSAFLARLKKGIVNSVCYNCRSFDRDGVMESWFVQCTVTLVCVVLLLLLLLLLWWWCWWWCCIGALIKCARHSGGKKQVARVSDDVGGVILPIKEGERRRYKKAEKDNRRSSAQQNKEW